MQTESSLHYDINLCLFIELARMATSSASLTENKKHKKELKLLLETCPILEMDGMSIYRY